MRSTPTVLLAIAVLCVCTSAAVQAQDLQVRATNIIHSSGKEFCTFGTRDDLHVIGTTAVYGVYVCKEGKKKAINLVVWDKETGQVLTKNTAPLPENMLAAVSSMEVGGKTYLAFTCYDRPTGKLDLVALGIDPETHTLEPARTVLTIPLKPKAEVSSYWRFGYRNTEEGDKLLVYSDNVKTSESEQLMLAWVFGNELEELWKGVYRIQFESDNIATADVELSSSGNSVYFLMRSKFKNRAITNRNINYSYQVFQATPDAFTSWPVALPNDLTALNCVLAVLPNDNIRLAGFHVRPDETIQETAGIFVQDLDPDIQPIAAMQVHMFPKKVEHQLMRMSLLNREDGSSYLLGGSWDGDDVQPTGGTVVVERMLLVAHLDKKGGLAWHREIPREIRSFYLAKYGYYAQLIHDQLVVEIPDIADNLSRYNAGEEPNKVSVNEEKRETLVVQFDDAGRPRYKIADHGGTVDYGTVTRRRNEALLYMDNRITDRNSLQLYHYE